MSVKEGEAAPLPSTPPYSRSQDSAPPRPLAQREAGPLGAGGQSISRYSAGKVYMQSAYDLRRERRSPSVSDPKAMGLNTRKPALGRTHQR